MFELPCMMERLFPGRVNRANRKTCWLFIAARMAFQQMTIWRIIKHCVPFDIKHRQLPPNGFPVNLRLCVDIRPHPA